MNRGAVAGVAADVRSESMNEPASREGAAGWCSRE
jgi:hypothetical protein